MLHTWLPYAHTTYRHTPCTTRVLRGYYRRPAVGALVDRLAMDDGRMDRMLDGYRLRTRVRAFPYDDAT